MALQEACVEITLEAGADLSAKQYLFVDIASDGQVDPVASAGAKGIGVLTNKPDAAGKAASVQVYGVAKVIAGGTVDEGDKVQSDATGKAITAASGDHVFGTCVKGGDSGELIEVLLISQHLLA